MSGGRLPKRIVFGNLEGAVCRGRGGKEKEWTDCVQSDIRAFGIAGDWKATALKAEVWVETVTEGGRRFMAARRKEEVDAARHRQEKREATRLGNLATTLRTRRYLWAGTFLRMSGKRLPKRIVFGNLEGAVRRGRGGKEKEWTDCVQSDIRAFDIAGDWKATALKADVWVETVTEGGRRFMAARRKEEEDAARHRQEKREATKLGNLLSQTGV